MKAVLNKIRISSLKANLVAGIVRGKKVNEALAILKFMPKKGANILYKVVNSAAHNAKNNFKQDIDELFITEIVVTKGPSYKRSLPVSRGRNHPILKRTCNIMVEVGLNKDEMTEQPARIGTGGRHDEITAKKELKKTDEKSEKKVEEKIKKTTVKKTEEKVKKTIAKKIDEKAKKTVAKKTGKNKK
jgi:large subunit ribosomal protein L22